MATRAEIIVEGVDFAKVYKHYDGYPEGTLPWLRKFHTEFINIRGEDPEYEFAQLLRSSWRDAEEFGLDDSKTTGWGVIPFNANCGAEYRYVLKGNGDIEIFGVFYELDEDDGSIKSIKWKKIRNIRS